MCHGHRYTKIPNTCGLEEKPGWALVKGHENTWFFGIALLWKGLEWCECGMREILVTQEPSRLYRHAGHLIPFLMSRLSLPQFVK